MSTVIAKTYVASAKDMEVFKRAYSLSLLIHQHCKKLPVEERYSLADQMRRASRSICANLAEGFAKQKDSPAEFGRFISMAIGSCAEMDIWLSYCIDLGYFELAPVQPLQDGYEIVL